MAGQVRPNREKQGKEKDHESSEAFCSNDSWASAHCGQRIGGHNHRLRSQSRFAHYKTYSWGKIQTSDGLWDARVKTAVGSQLAAKGLSEVPSGGDVVVAARDAIHNEQELNTFYDGFG